MAITRLNKSRNCNFSGLEASMVMKLDGVLDHRDLRAAYAKMLEMCSVQSPRGSCWIVCVGQAIWATQGGGYPTESYHDVRASRQARERFQTSPHRFLSLVLFRANASS